jgi:single-strand DNA-binding protein
MNNLNSILIEGNLVRDAVLKSTPKGVPVCSFTIASNRYHKKDEGFDKEVGFFDIESWGKLAEACFNKGKKSSGVRVVGRLKQDRWNSTDGKKHFRIKIVAEHVEFRPEFLKTNKQGADENADQYDEAESDGLTDAGPEISNELVDELVLESVSA